MSSFPPENFSAEHVCYHNCYVRSPQHRNCASRTGFHRRHLRRAAVEPEQTVPEQITNNF